MVQAGKRLSGEAIFNFNTDAQREVAWRSAGDSRRVK
jgi:hypothetical protein